MSSRIRAIVPLFLLGLAGVTSLRAQGLGDVLSSATAAYYNDLIDGMFSYLTPDQRAEFKNALYPALDKNPQLVSDGMDLLKEGGKQVDPSSPGGADAYLGRMRDYEARLRAAMTEQDANIGKIFDQIDAHMPRATHP